MRRRDKATGATEPDSLSRENEQRPDKIEQVTEASTEPDSMSRENDKVMDDFAVNAQLQRSPTR